ncbi:O-antigen ligase family protein [Motilimonas eburnea]|uniref:O-antigen ligase family protein n=1 Tax=Motilimonas eburnea TaxID=1737488 RepID=UPI001E4F10EE|nr:O-antigen ligase family protein [Motilimonas eburnea]MCE2570639.1 O-antigen ligase family protein [Motilimonas eburnea]
MSAMQKGCYWAFLLFVFYLPFPLGGNRPWLWSINEIWLSGLILATLFCFSFSQWRDAILRVKWLFTPLLLFTLWTALQYFAVGLTDLSWVASVDPAQTWIQLLKTLSYLWLVMLAGLFITTHKQLTQLAYVMILSGVLQGFYGAFLVLAQIDPTPVFSLPLNSRAAGSFVYHNHLANFLMLTLCLGFGLLVSQLQHGQHQNLKQAMAQFFATFLTTKALIRMALIIMVIALVLTRSRMGNTAFFSALTLGSLLLLVVYKNKPKSLYILVGSIFVIDTVIVSTWFGLDKVKERLVATNLDAETRDNVVRFALNAIEQRPMSGYGAGSFYSEFQRFNEHGIYLFYDHAHNEYIQFLFESGLIGTTLLGLAIVIALMVSTQQFIKREDPLVKGIALACVMTIVGMLIHISVDFPLQAPATTCYFLLILSIALVLPSIHQRKRKKRSVD